MVTTMTNDIQSLLGDKAESLLGDPPLTMLLSAQAAQLSGDEKAAGKFFEAMAQQSEPETRYLGLHGMLTQAMHDGDQEQALELARQEQQIAVQNKSRQESQARAEADEARAKVTDYIRNGCTCPILYPLGDDVELMIETFTNGRFG